MAQIGKRRVGTWADRLCMLGRSLYHMRSGNRRINLCDSGNLKIGYPFIVYRYVSDP